MILHSISRPTYGLEVAHTAQVDERRGQEAAQADVEDQATLDHLDDRALDDPVLLLDLLDRAPGSLVLRALLGQDEATVLVLLLEDEGFEFIVERHDLVRVDVVADGELARGDDALGLEADVEQHFVAVDLHDPAGDDVAVVELDDGGVDRVGERLSAEVVEDDELVLALFLVVVVVASGAASPASAGFGRLAGRLFDDGGVDGFRVGLVGRAALLGDGGRGGLRHVLIRQLLTPRCGNFSRRWLTGGRGRRAPELRPNVQATGLPRIS